jgi:hypothetical protein
MWPTALRVSICWSAAESRDRASGNAARGTAEFTNNGNSYASFTTIENGRLLVNNTAGNGTGTSEVLINGGVLSGTGSVTTRVGFGNGGGIIAPGDATGTLTANCDVDFTSAGATAFNVMSVPLSGHRREKLLLRSNATVQGQCWREAL